MAGNIFADGMDAYKDTNAVINGIQKKRADVQAAPMIAAGNFGGAAQAYGEAGLAPEARQNVIDQQVMSDRATASATAAKTEQAAEVQRKADGFLHVIDAVGAAPAGQRLARFKAISGTVRDLGVDPSHFATATEDDFSDSNLASLKALVGKAAADYTLGADQERRSGATNQVVAKGPPKPQEYLVLPEGARAVPKPMNGETVGNPAPVGPAASPALSAPAAAGPASSQVRGVRNNNPLNITGQGWQGQVGSDGPYATFSTPEQGQAAADKNLQAYATKHGINTLSGIINRWAPASGGNDTASYIQSVASDLHVDPNAPLNLSDPKVRAVVLHSMSKVELGGEAPGQAQPARAALPAPVGGPQPGDPPGTLYGAPKPMQWTSDGKGNLINANGDRKIDPTAAASAEADPNLVKAIIDGRAPMPTANRAATDPKWQAAMAEAMAQDPTLDGANYGTRVKTRADFAVGAAAKTKTALNTALGHAGDLDSQVDHLHNTGIQPFNEFANAVGTRVSDQRRADINTFNLTKEALMHEGMKVFSGSAGSMAEFMQLASTLDANDGPKSQHAVVKKLVNLLASKMDALGEQYKTGMGKELDQSQIMSPHAAQVFNKISGLATTAAPEANAIPTLSPQDAAKLPKGSKFRTTDGRLLVRP